MLAMPGPVLSFYFYCAKNLLHVPFEMRLYFVVNNSNLHVACSHNILWFTVRAVAVRTVFGPQKCIQSYRALLCLNADVFRHLKRVEIVQRELLLNLFAWMDAIISTYVVCYIFVWLSSFHRKWGCEKNYIEGVESPSHVETRKYCWVKVSQQYNLQQISLNFYKFLLLQINGCALKNIENVRIVDLYVECLFLREAFRRRGKLYLVFEYVERVSKHMWYYCINNTLTVLTYM